ncbi:ankyrin [Macroventuria anomochaeta]|uniref:Ankyrin n=1 Tax=Macroventuria anomochaeta TaxID=301207 RepID=A0ACB6S7M7_9PLEO|nr:ankyrin [Macroventuria anomochaeta]KAF2629137.1 ankyrin [Macroventuria anomochaeta]
MDSAPQPLENELHTVFNWWNSARTRDTTALETLLEAGFKIDSRARDQSTAPHCAAYAGQIAVVEFLLYKDAQLNLSNMRGETPLSGAAIGGNPDCILALLRAGACVRYFRPREDTPKLCFVGHVVRIGDTSLVESIVKSDTPQINTHGASKTYAFAVAAAKIGQMSFLRLISDTDRAVFRNRRYGQQRPVYYAVSCGQVEAVRMLLAPVPYEIRETAASLGLGSLTQLAAQKGYLDILEILLEHGAEGLDSQCSYRRPVTALHLARREGHTEIEDPLIAYGATEYKLKEGIQESRPDQVRIEPERSIGDMASEMQEQDDTDINSDLEAPRSEIHPLFYRAFDCLSVF